MKKMEYIAHIRKSDRQQQTLKNHLLETADLAGAIGAKIGLEKTCYLAGILHDLGKYSTEFQEYLRLVAEHPDAPPKRGSVNHSSAGGIFLFQRLHQKASDNQYFLAEIVGNAILSHHSSRGLGDFISHNGDSDYLRRVLDPVETAKITQIMPHFYQEVMPEGELENLMEMAVKELRFLFKTKLKRQRNDDRYSSLFFLLKYVYSALIDGDRLNTMFFEENTTTKGQSLEMETANQVFFADCDKKLTHHLQTFKNNQTGKAGEINRLRTQMSNECANFSERETGIYTLSIPTGGGKTLASLRFALKHALKHHKQRIIYIVPYTTIIEQNAATVKKILGDSPLILEHHSNVIADVYRDDYFKEKQNKMAKDNWDSPIIFTTLVQFLETIYSKGTRNIRRFHNLSQTILIFDEVQSVPVKCVNLFNKVLNFLAEYADTTCVLCTATQPALDSVKAGLHLSAQPEMVQNLPAVTKAFKRVSIDYDASRPAMEEAEFIEFILAKHLEKRSLLIILNTKMAAKKTYLALKAKGLAETDLYHLSTSMCASHRQDTLAEIRAKLAAERPLICVTTQLIEAGVDVSFQCVIRSFAGLSSIAQAAGRCNRNGETSLQTVYLRKLSPQFENIDNGSLAEISKGQSVTSEVLYYYYVKEEDGAVDVLSESVMREYFKRFYHKLALEATYPMMDGSGRNLLEATGRNKEVENNFKDEKKYQERLVLSAEPARVAENFNVIDAKTTDILVPYNQEARELIADFNGEMDPKAMNQLFKRAQSYMVGIYDNLLDVLDHQGLVVKLYNGDVLALKESGYNLEFGVDLTGNGGESFQGIF